MKKVTFKIKSKKHESLISWFLKKFKNISIFPESNYLTLELLLNNSEIKSLSSDKIKKEFDHFTVTTIKNKNWVFQNMKHVKGVQTELFFISQGLSKKKQNRKFELTVPANNAFGTGSHASTYLSIICIEYLIKKKKILFSL